MQDYNLNFSPHTRRITTPSNTHFPSSNDTSKTTTTCQTLQKEMKKNLQLLFSMQLKIASLQKLLEISLDIVGLEYNESCDSFFNLVGAWRTTC
jgi:hypothetical protein